MALPSRLSLLPSTLASMSAANSLGTSTLTSQQRKHLRPSTSSAEISRAVKPISMSSVTKHLWDLSWSTHHQYGTTVSNATSIKSNRFSATLHVSPVVITDGHLVWQPCCRSCNRFIPTTMSSQQGSDAVPNQKWSRRHTCCSLYLEPVPTCTIRFEMCRFRAIQTHTVRPSFRVQSGCGTLCQ